MLLLKIFLSVVFTLTRCSSSDVDTNTIQGFQSLLKLIKNLFPSEKFYEVTQRYLNDQELSDFGRYVQTQNFSAIFNGLVSLPSIQLTIKHLEEKGAVRNGNAEVNRIGYRIQKIINGLANGVGAFNIPRELKNNGGLSDYIDEIIEMIPAKAILRIMKNKSTHSYKVTTQILSMIDQREVEEHVKVLNEFNLKHLIMIFFQKSERIQNLLKFLNSKKVNVQEIVNTIQMMTGR